MSRGVGVAAGVLTNRLEVPGVARRRASVADSDQLALWDLGEEPGDRAGEVTSEGEHHTGSSLQVVTEEGAWDEPVRDADAGALREASGHGVGGDRRSGEFLRGMGLQIETEIDTLADEIADPSDPSEGYLERVGRLTEARTTAESEVLREHMRPGLTTPPNT